MDHDFDDIEQEIRDILDEERSGEYGAHCPYCEQSHTLRQVRGTNAFYFVCEVLEERVNNVNNDIPDPEEHRKLPNLSYVVRRIWETGYIKKGGSIYYTTIVRIMNSVSIVDVDWVDVRSCLEMSGCDVGAELVTEAALAAVFADDDSEDNVDAVDNGHRPLTEDEAREQEDHNKNARSIYPSLSLNRRQRETKLIKTILKHAFMYGRVIFALFLGIEGVMLAMVTMPMFLPSIDQAYVRADSPIYQGLLTVMPFALLLFELVIVGFVMKLVIPEREIRELFKSDKEPEPEPEPEIEPEPEPAFIV